MRISETAIKPDGNERVRRWLRRRYGLQSSLSVCPVQRSVREEQLSQCDGLTRCGYFPANDEGFASTTSRFLFQDEHALFAGGRSSKRVTLNVIHECQIPVFFFFLAQ